jgi:hypothetical protein
LYVFNSDSEDVVSTNLLTLLGFDKKSPLWKHFHAIVESFYKSMSFLHASMEFSNKIIDEMASDSEAKLKAEDERVNSLGSEINKLK